MLERKEKFAFVTYTRSAIFTLTGELKGEKKPPKNFVKLLSDGMQKKDPNFIKAVQKDLMLSSMDKLASLNIKGVEFYDPAFLELYINNNYDGFYNTMSATFNLMTGDLKLRRIALNDVIIKTKVLISHNLQLIENNNNNNVQSN